MSDELRPLDAPLKYDEPWARGVQKFLEEGYTYGDALPHTWFYEAMGLDNPKTASSAIEYEKRQFVFMQQFQGFREYLVRTHKMHLNNCFAFGYEVVKPEAQTALANENLSDGLRKLLRKTARLLVDIDHSRLTDAQRAENDQALGRLAFFKKESRRLLV